jgi:hypothetical protein
LFAQSNNATLFGTISDEAGKPLELTNISIKSTTIGTVSNLNGEYLLRIPAKKPVVIVFSLIGYQSVEKTITANEEEKIEINLNLLQINKEIGEVQVSEHRRTNTNLSRIDPKYLNIMTDAGTGGVEALIKTLPGVSTNNELSSQYSVRGGNFDENLVYVNDVEVYRPMLVTSGQQEGMSFINSDMVSSIEFSAGGFEAKYGDKMSSVLDIRYRKPTGFAGSASISLLGGSMHIEDQSKNGKFSHISGIRYKTNQYLLGTLDTKGEYNPRFLDFQTYLTYRVTEKFDLSFLGNIANNQYNFIPQNRQTSFGTYEKAYKATIYFEGQELDDFSTYTGAVIANYHPNVRLNMKLIASAFHTNEAVTYDILGQYYLNELEKDLGSDELGDSILNVGVGTFLNHARNYLKVNVFSLEQKGAYNSEKHLINWGVKIQSERIDDRMSEWTLRDSTGYSIPYNGESIELYTTNFSSYKMQSLRLSGFLQDTYQIPISEGNLYASAGVRAQYWNYSTEFLLSPRASLRYYPYWNKNFIFHLAGGFYHQAPFFKELKDRNGNIYPETKAQRTIQVVLGTDYIFKAWDRPFKYSSDIYYKYMPKLIPYQIDNVRIWYLPNEESRGYAAGWDMKVNGEFVSGIESWASLSLMKTVEDVLNDGHGFIPRPTDQRFNFSIFFQDYFPGNPSYKMHLTAFYGSRLPIGPPLSERYMDTFRIPPYRRIDLGFSKILISPHHPKYRYRAFDGIKDLWVSFEVFNLLDINNTISYTWVSNNSGDRFAVPNYLTGRRLDVKLIVKF